MKINNSDDVHYLNFLFINSNDIKRNCTISSVYRVFHGRETVTLFSFHY